MSLNAIKALNLPVNCVWLVHYKEAAMLNLCGTALSMCRCYVNKLRFTAVWRDVLSSFGVPILETSLHSFNLTGLSCNSLARHICWNFVIN